MELVNTSDNRTKYDRRYVYDEILKRLAPQGINVFGFCEDDAHEFSDCDRNAQYFLINGDKSVAVSEANASPNSTQIQAAQQLYRDSMFYGEFYTSSKSSKNSYELGDGFTAVGDYPSVSNISVDNATDQITVSCKDATKVRLVADGTIIATAKTNASGDTVVFDLNKYEDKINSYVRIYMTGNGGITYLQPFLLTKDQLHQATVQFILPTSDIAVVVKEAAPEPERQLMEGEEVALHRQGLRVDGPLRPRHGKDGVRPAAPGPGPPALLLRGDRGLEQSGIDGPHPAHGLIGGNTRLSLGVHADHGVPFLPPGPPLPRIQVVEAVPHAQHAQLEDPADQGGGCQNERGDAGGLQQLMIDLVVHMRPRQSPARRTCWPSEMGVVELVMTNSLP